MCSLASCLTKKNYLKILSVFKSVDCIQPCHTKKNLNLNLKSKEMVLRPTYQYQLPLSKTSRYGRDFIPCMQHIKDVLDCFRLDLLLLLLVLLVLLLCACVCVCFNLLSDNESNIILSFGILYHFNVRRLHCNKYIILSYLILSYP